MSDKSFTIKVNGQVKKPGSYMASGSDTLLDLIFRDAGGIANDRFLLKAVLSDGTLGYFVSENDLKRPVVKSGQIMIVDQGSCMVNVLRMILAYNQICLSNYKGCSECRAALTSALTILSDLVSARGTMADLTKLQQIAFVQNSGCQDECKVLKPLRTCLELYYEEFQAHALGKCPASICGELVASPCSNACPANVDLPGTIAFMQMGKFAEALALGRHDNPLFLTCGFVCEEPPCQKNCKRLTFDEAIYSQALHRFAGDSAAGVAGSLAKALQHSSIQPGVATGKKVAIVGAGPAGLAAAYFLARFGHKAVIYEKDAVAGGMAATGIPSYRVDRQVLAEEVKSIRNLGVDIITGCALGKDISFEELYEGFDAILLAIGAGVSRKLDIPGENLANVLGAIEFLGEVALQGKANIGGNVIVVGGGNVAIDAARTAVRLGAKSVTLLCVEDYFEMPASKHEIAAAKAEGIRLIGLSVPIQFIGTQQVEQVVYTPVTPGPYDFAGRRWPPLPDRRNQTAIPADMVIVAIGQMLDVNGISKIQKQGAFLAVSDYATGLPGVFAAGDCAGPVNTVVKAVRAGKDAAFAIDRFLMNAKREIEFHLREQLGCFSGPCMCHEAPRVQMPEQSAAQRTANFDLVELGLVKEQAHYEMLRCICAAKGGMEG